MDTYCASPIGLLCFVLIHSRIDTKNSLRKKALCKILLFTFKYIENIMSLHNTHFSERLHIMYSRELEIRCTSYLDLSLNIDNDGCLESMTNMV